MTPREVFITTQGLERLTKELKYLKTIRRKEVAQRVESAKEYGDLSENAEYVEAKNEQAFVEGRIADIDEIIKHAVVIEEQRSGTSVQVGSTIIVENDGKETQYFIVGSNEADPTSGKISNESPLGQAFLGKQAGETVEIKTPRGKLKYRISSIG